MPRLYYPGVSDEEWPPPEVKARAALWGAEHRLANGDYVAAAAALDDAFTYGDRGTAAVARGLRQLAAAGYRHRDGDSLRAQRSLARARVRLSPFLPVFEEVDLAQLLHVVAEALES